MSEPEIPDCQQKEIQQPAVEAQLSEQVAKSLGLERKKLLLLTCGVMVIICIAHFTPLRSWVLNVQTWKTYVREKGIIAHFGFVMACALAVMVGVPRLPLCGMAGLVFGLAEGLVLSLCGTVAGAYSAFLMTRLGLKNTKLASLNKLAWLKEQLVSPTLVRVFWVRQLMVPGLALNVLLGISGVTHRVFVIGTLIGYLPLNLTVTLVGSGVGKSTLTESMTQILAAVGLINIVVWLTWKKKSMNQL